MQFWEVDFGLLLDCSNNYITLSTCQGSAAKSPYKNNLPTPTKRDGWMIEIGLENLDDSFKLRMLDFLWQHRMQEIWISYLLHLFQAWGPTFYRWGGLSLNLNMPVTTQRCGSVQKLPYTPKICCCYWP